MLNGMLHLQFSLAAPRGHLAHGGGSFQTLPNSGPHAQMAVDNWMATLVGSWLMGLLNHFGKADEMNQT